MDETFLTVYSIPLAVLNDGYRKCGILCAISERMKVEIGTVRPILTYVYGLYKLSEASFIFICTVNDDFETLHK